MITVNGERWGTAADIASGLGADIKAATVRRWADPKRWANPDSVLTSQRVGQTVYYPFSRAAEIERDKRQSGRGRPRQLDSVLAVA